MERRPATAEEARALANPLRLRILRLCLDQALTNKELADRLGRDPGTILHHVRLLVATGFLAADADRRGLRGSTERPYRATGKSWTLDVGESESGALAMIEAFRDEVAESTAGDIVTLSRLGVRLTPDAAAAFGRRLATLVEELYAADDPAGEPFGLLVGLHRRHEKASPAPADRGPLREAFARSGKEAEVGKQTRR
jgi:predicted ArsR family transcriptional regulator